MNKHQDTKQDPRGQQRQQGKPQPEPSNKGQPGQQRADARENKSGSRSRSEAN